MFKIEPISTTNILSILQILVVVGGFYFSWRSLEAAIKTLSLGTRNAQAQLFNQMVIQGRDLQFKFAELFHGGNDEKNLKARQDHFIGTLLGYYSSCFELKNVLELPSNAEKLLKEDLRELMREGQVRKKWDDVKHLHSKEFVAYVDSVRGVS